jgi:hypothetical protein
MRLTGRISRGSRRVVRTAAVAVVAGAVLAGGGQTRGAAVQTASARPAANSGATAPIARLASAVGGRGLTIVSGTSGRTAGLAGGLPPVDIGVYDTCSKDSPYTGGNPPFALSAFLGGWSNASKLGGALTVGYPAPALAGTTHFQEGGFTDTNGFTWDCFRGSLNLDYRGKAEFPPTTATFLAFGFMPVTATVHLIQAGPIDVIAYEDTSNPFGASGPFTVVSTAPVSLQVTGVKVNGVPLDVGNDCRTAGILTSPPADNPVGAKGLVMVGGNNAIGGNNANEPAPLYAFGFAGSLAGIAKIPPFTGCVTPGGENVDALLTSSVSSSGNLVHVDQGPPCENGYPQYCVGGVYPDPTKLEQPVVEPLWTVKNGGTFTTAAVPAEIWLGRNPNSFSHISCTSKLTASVPSTAGPPRGDTVTITSWTFSGCSDQFGNSWTVTQHGTTPLDAQYVGLIQPAGTMFLVGTTLLDLATNGCTMQMGGFPAAEYQSGVLTFDTSSSQFNIVNPTGSSCSNINTGNPTLHNSSSGQLAYQFNRPFEITSP